MPRLTYYPHQSVRSKRPGTIVDIPWPELARYLESASTNARAKGASGYWVAAACHGPHSDVACEPTDLVALDWEGSDPELPGVAFVAHTTDSHSEAEPRWRVWVRLDRAYSAEELRRVINPWAATSALRAISQPAFIPTMGEDTWWLEAPASASAWAPELRPAEPPTQPRSAQPRAGRQNPSQASTNALVTRWFADPSGTNRLAGALGSVLAEWGWTDVEVEGYLTAWLHADPKLAKHTDDALRGAAKRRAGDRIVGFPALAEALGQAFEAERPEALDLSAILLDAGAPPRPAPPAGGEPPFYWRDAHDILTRELPPIQWVCEALSLAPGAPAVCTGYSGVGKTTALQDLALAVATPGRKWLSFFEVRHGSVAHVDLEQGEQQTYRTYRALGATAEAALQCSVLPSWRLSDRENLEALARAAVGRTLIIIDSFRAACPDGDENASEYAAPMGDLGRISEATGCTFILNHHSGKNNSDRMRSARGTSAITAAASVHWSFEREDLDPGTRPCLQLVKSRNHATDAMVWETYVEKVGNAESFRLHARANAGEDSKAREVGDAVVALLATGWRGSKSALVRELRKGRTTVFKALSELTRDGIIEEFGQGVRLVSVKNTNDPE